jgi:hypothetical protein
LNTHDLAKYMIEI